MAAYSSILLRFKRERQINSGVAVTFCPFDCLDDFIPTVRLVFLVGHAPRAPASRFRLEQFDCSKKIGFRRYRRSIAGFAANGDHSCFASDAFHRSDFLPASSVAIFAFMHFFFLSCFLLENFLLTSNYLPILHPARQAFLRLEQPVLDFSMLLDSEPYVGHISSYQPCDSP
jgi:hypothetical protein